MTSTTKPVLTLVPEITDPDLQSELGAMYFFGRGIAQNMARGVYWYRKAALQGHIEAQCNLGFCYQRGAGVRKDVKQALHWYTQAANQNDAFSAYYLGMIYERGEGVPVNCDLACEWFGLAASLGHREATIKKSELENRSNNVITFPLRRLAFNATKKP